MTTMRSMNPDAPNFVDASAAAARYASFVNEPKNVVATKYFDDLNKEKLAEEARAEELRRYNQEFGLKQQEFALKQAAANREQAKYDRELNTDKALLDYQNIIRGTSQGGILNNTEGMSLANEYHKLAGTVGEDKAAEIVNTKAQILAKQDAKKAQSDPFYAADRIQGLTINGDRYGSIDPTKLINMQTGIVNDYVKRGESLRDHNATQDYRNQSLDLEREKINYQRKKENEEIKKQEAVAKTILQNSMPQNVTEQNGEYNTISKNIQDTNVKIQTLNDLLNGKLTSEDIDALSKISDKDAILNAAQKEKERLAYVNKNSIGAIYDDPTIMKPVVNQNILKLVNGNQKLYDKVINDPTIVSNYKALSDYKVKVKDYENMLSKVPATVTNSVTPSAPEVANKVLNDPNISYVTKLQALTLLGGEDNSLGSLFNTSGSNGKSNSGLGSLSLGGGDNSSSIAKKKYKAELNDKQAVLYQNLKTIEEKNPNIPQNVLVALKEADTMGSPAAVQEVIKTYFNEDYLLKDSLEAKNKLIVKTLQSTINTKEDTDKDTMKNINAFVNKNQDVIKQLTPTQIETFLEKVKVNYPSELGTFDFNWLGKSPIADSLSEVVEEHNKDNPNIKWSDLPF